MPPWARHALRTEAPVLTVPSWQTTAMAGFAAAEAMQRARTAAARPGRPVRILPR